MYACGASVGKPGTKSFRVLEAGDIRKRTTDLVREMGITSCDAGNPKGHGGVPRSAVPDRREGSGVVHFNYVRD
jgi:hypothetical protein